VKYVISLVKALNAEYGGPVNAGPTGPGARHRALPDFSIYYAPPERHTQEREDEAARLRQAGLREKHRGFWGPAPKVSPELRYEPTRAEVVRGKAKIHADRLKFAQKPYEPASGEDEDEDSPKTRRARRASRIARRKTKAE